jgi:hypothetical protein
MMKSRLHKLEGLTYDDLKENIDNVIKETPKEKYCAKGIKQKYNQMNISKTNQIY